MGVTVRPVSHLILTGAMALLLLAPVRSLAQSPDPAGSSTFIVLIDGVRIGTETVTITRSGANWIVSGTGFIRPPLDVSTSKLEIRYGPDWHPQAMSLVSAQRGEPLAITTSFGLTTATSALVRGAQRINTTHDIAPRSVVIPNNFFAAYESLAVRLATSPSGTRIPVHVPPTGDTVVTVSAITPKRVSLGASTIEVREFQLTAMDRSGVIPLEMWIDDRGRLARMVMPTASLVVIRDDLAHVMAREERLGVEGDEDVLIGSQGFAISGTFTPARDVTGRAPVVVLAGGYGPQDRDHVAHGVPVYAHLARTLSEAGYAVLRYDARGVGRTGGRPESSRLQEYTDDVLTVVNWLRGRREVDRDRIVVAGYGDTGPVALLAASRTSRIAAVMLLNAPGHTGREVTLERQRVTMAAADVSEAERENRLALQVRVLDAVTSGRGWEGIPAEVRHQADTPWFRSWLLFDPADTMRRTSQPILILHGTGDVEVPPDHAAHLDELGRMRRNRPAAHTRLVMLDGVNHVLMDDTAGVAPGYAMPATGSLAPSVDATIVDWLGDVLIER